MHTKTITNDVIPYLLVFLFSVPSIQAETITENYAPYQLQISPPKMPLSSDVAKTSIKEAQIYKLEYKYRSQSKPLKIKTAVPYEQALTESLKLPLTENMDTEIKLRELPFSKEIALAAHAASLDPSLVHAVIYVESRYRHNAISPKGAVGLMQVMPATAARYGLRDGVHLPKDNIKAGTLYLRDLMTMFDSRLDLVLAAYNAGEGAVKKYAMQIPPYPETRHYVKAVMAKYALNTGKNEWKSINNNDSQPIEHLAKAQTQYLVGTDLAISNKEFKLKN